MNDIISKRDGQNLGQSELTRIADAIATGTASDAQVGAFAMAVFLNGFSASERSQFTNAMVDSGLRLNWELPGPVIDKHSTGGVGDATSLVLAPALAACGAYIPMISGRGLGNTGGTLDKLEAIEGLNVVQTPENFNQIVAGVGCAIIGQSDSIAPADRRLYAIRDITGTVNTLDLIIPSILSKKIAAGVDALVLDVKYGNGGFSSNLNEVRKLAQNLVDVANAAGCRTTALITDMDEPLSSASGNALEVKAALDFLTGQEIEARFWDVVLGLGGDLLVTASLATTRAEGQTMIADAITSGRAAEKFGMMVAAQGGPNDLVERPQKYLGFAPVVSEIYARSTGFITQIDTAEVGAISVSLGAGRLKETDVINPLVGVDWIRERGLWVDAEQPIARIHAANQSDLEKAQKRLIDCFKISDTAPMDDFNPIVERISG